MGREGHIPSFICGIARAYDTPLRPQSSGDLVRLRPEADFEFSVSYTNSVIIAINQGEFAITQKVESVLGYG